MTRTVLIREQNFDGHRWMYVRLLLGWLRDEQAVVHVATSSAAPSEVLTNMRERGVQIHLGDWSSLERLSDLSNRIGANLVVVPDGDQVALALGQGAKWSSNAMLRPLVMRAHAQPTGSLIKDLGRRGARNALLCAAALRRNVDLVTLCSGIEPCPGIHEVPDPVEFAPDGQSPIRLDPNVFWVGIVGAIDERKNPQMVIESCAVASTRYGVRLGVVIAGRIAEPLTSATWMQGETLIPLHLHDRLLSDGELDAIIRDLDAVVLAHSNDGPSGILVKAAAAGTRVLAAGSPVLHHDVQTFGQGAFWTPLNISELADGIAAITRMERPRAHSLDSVKFCRRMLK